MPKKVSIKKDGVSQSVHIHIHEKSKEQKRRRKRRKVSRAGAIRTINRFVPAPSELPQVRFSKQQLVVLPEGDKALGQVGVKQLTAGEQMGLQKKLMMETIKEYEEEVRGKSTQERILPVADTGNNKPAIRRLADLKDVNIETILRNRKTEAIKEFNIDPTLPKRELNNKIREAHALVATNPLTRTPKKPNTPQPAPHSPLQSPPRISKGGGLNPFNIGT